MLDEINQSEFDLLAHCTAFSCLDKALSLSKVKPASVTQPCKGGIIGLLLDCCLPPVEVPCIFFKCESKAT